MVYLQTYNGPSSFLPKKVGAGPNAIVYQISPDIVVKFLTEGKGLLRKIREDDFAEHDINTEYVVADRLYGPDFRISIPEPIGAFKVPIRPLLLQHLMPKKFRDTVTKRKLPGFVMKKVNGIYIEDAPENKKKELIELAEVELSKALMAGLSFLRNEYNVEKNVLWVPPKNNSEQDRVVLTGLSAYHLPGVFRESPPKPASKSN